MKGPYWIVVLLLCLFVRPTLAQQPGPGPSLGKFPGGVLRLQRLGSQVNRCTAMAPDNWYVVAATPQGTAIDLATQDGAAHAGYSITGVSSTLRRHPNNQWSSPEVVIHTVLSRQGREPVQYGPAQQDPFGYIIQPYERMPMVGIVVYRVIPAPADPGGFILVTREASVRKDIWPAYGTVAIATAMSIRCVASISPPGPSMGPGPGAKSIEDRHESTYNVQLGMEYAHDSRTGENYWVSPSRDFHRDGPAGPGYYKSVGHDLIKLDPGTAP